MPKWEYLFFSTTRDGIWANDKQIGKRGESVAAFLNRMGQEGWEAVSMVYISVNGPMAYLLKRPIE